MPKSHKNKNIKKSDFFTLLKAALVPQRKRKKPAAKEKKT
jgi:hypothetical protein